MSRWYGKKPERAPEPVVPVSGTPTITFPWDQDMPLPEDPPLESEEIFPDEENDS